MQERIGLAVLAGRPGRRVVEFGGDHVAGAAIFPLSAFADADFDFLLDGRHRFPHGIAERIKNPLVAVKVPEQADTLGAIEGEVVKDAALRLVT